MKKIGIGEVFGLLICWAGAGTMSYIILQNKQVVGDWLPIVLIVITAACYYLSKWIVLGQECSCNKIKDDSVDE